MTVKELIQLLTQQDENKEVMISNDMFKWSIERVVDDENDGVLFLE